MTFYWSKLLVNLAMLASVTCILVFGIRAGMRGEQLALIIGPLFLAAQQLLPAVEKAKTTFPPAASGAAPIAIPRAPSIPVIDTAPNTPEVKP